MHVYFFYCFHVYGHYYHIIVSEIVIIYKQVNNEFPAILKYVCQVGGGGGDWILRSIRSLSAVISAGF